MSARTRAKKGAMGTTTTRPARNEPIGAPEKMSRERMEIVQEKPWAQALYHLTDAIQECPGNADILPQRWTTFHDITIKNQASFKDVEGLIEELVGILTDWVFPEFKRLIEKLSPGAGCPSRIAVPLASIGELWEALGNVRWKPRLIRALDLVNQGTESLEKVL